jgi:hypothetical protein
MEEEEKVFLSFGRQHIDLIQKVVATDAAAGMDTVVLEADPRRYDWEEVEGSWLLIDKFEPNVMQAEDFFALLRRIIHQPFYHEIKDTTVAGIQKKSLRIYVTRQRPPSG